MTIFSRWSVAACASAFVVFALAHVVLAQSPQVKEFKNSIVPIPAQTGPLPNVLALNESDQNRKLTLHFALETEGVADLEKRVGRGEIVSPKELTEKYSGSKQHQVTLVSWLKTQGFKGIQVSADSSNVYATATVAQIQKSLDVKMSQVTYKGKVFPAATTPPKLPVDVGEHVVAIDGLQPFAQAHKQSVARANYVPTNQPTPHSIVPRPMAATLQQTYRVAEVMGAYGASQIGVTGAGQVIAILIDNYPNVADLNSFWSANSLPVNSRVQEVNIHPGTPLFAPDGEETLDAEWTSGVAPGANVRVYACGSLDYPAIDQALDRILQDAETTPTERHLSISLGLREDLVSPDEIAAERTEFLKLAALGVTTFVSSGDAGSNPDSSGHARSPDRVVEYESSDPYVVAVGGTSLQLNRANGAIIRETAWVDSGGGVSTIFPISSWQPGVAAISTTHRLVPDVSAVADPVPGAYVILNGAEYPVGGTSWSAPIWAGISALIAEARAKSNHTPIGYLAPKLYAVAQNNSFRDITEGSNGAFSAGPGWDAVTGLGVPNVAGLIAALNTKYP
jgi:kumamolisin